jgi:PAS domain S-box-containing protein
MRFDMVEDERIFEQEAHALFSMYSQQLVEKVQSRGAAPGLPGTVLEELLRNHFVGSAAIRLANGEVVSLDRDVGETREYEFPLIDHSTIPATHLGSFVLGFDLRYMLQRHEGHIPLLVFLEFLQAFLVACFLIVLFYFVVGKTIHQLAAYTLTLAGNAMPAPLLIRGGRGAADDELKNLEYSLNVLRDKIVVEKKAIERKKQEAELIEAISGLFAVKQTGGTVFNDFCRIVAEKMGFSAAVFFFLSPMRNVPRERTGFFSRSPAFPCHECKENVCAMVKALTREGKGRQLGLLDIKDRPDICSGLKKFGVQSLLAVDYGNYKDEIAIVAFFSDVTRDDIEADFGLIKLAINRFVPGITRKMAEDQLRRVDQRLFLILNTMREIIVYHDEEMRVMWANKAAADFVGVNLEQLVGRKCYELWDNRLDPCPKCPVIEARSKGETISAERQSLGRILKINSYPVWDDDSNSMKALQVAIDVTAQRQAEQSLLESEERYRSLVEEVFECIWEVDRNFRFTYCSPRMLDLLGFLPEEVMQKSAFCFIAPKEALVFARSAFKQYKKNGRISGLVGRAIHKEGREVFVEVSASPVLNDEGGILGFRGISRDVTKRTWDEVEEERQRQQLIQADKMVSLGILVSGVAHEVNNPTHFIRMNAPLLNQAWRDALPYLDEIDAHKNDLRLAGIPYARLRDYIPRLLNGIGEGAERIKDIVQNLKNYARKETSGMDQRVQINEVVNAALILLGNQLKNSTHTLNVQMQKNLPEIRGNFQRLEQVLVNVIMNACHALKTVDQGISIIIRPEGSDKVAVIVSDEGSGIPAADLPHVLDPFFTTKRDIGGTGLGLAISANIIKEHGGTIRVNSEEGRGTTISIELPISIEEEETERPV